MHCPTSNTFIGSGLFNLIGLAKAKVGLGLASDVGGGLKFFDVAHHWPLLMKLLNCKGRPFIQLNLIWLATEGSAKALHLEDLIGKLSPGIEADICVLNLNSTIAIDQRVRNSNNFWESYFQPL